MVVVVVEILVKVIIVVFHRANDFVCLVLVALTSQLAVAMVNVIFVIGGRAEAAPVEVVVVVVKVLKISQEHDNLRPKLVFVLFVYFLLLVFVSFCWCFFF